MKTSVPNSVVIAIGAVTVVVLIVIAWHMFGGAPAGTSLRKGDYKNPPPAARVGHAPR